MLRKRVETVLEMAVSTISSLAESFTAGTPFGGEAHPEEGTKADETKGEDSTEEAGEGDVKIEDGHTEPTKEVSVDSKEE